MFYTNGSNLIQDQRVSVQSTTITIRTNGKETEYDIERDKKLVLVSFQTVLNILSCSCVDPTKIKLKIRVGA